MGYNDYKRYALLDNSNGIKEEMPFINISVSNTDKYEFWKENKSRYDILSQKYYGNPFYDFLILYANPNYLSQFDIPTDTLIRIPFPLNRALSEYENVIRTSNRD